MWRLVEPGLIGERPAAGKSWGVIWLGLMVGIVYVGFPEAFSQLSTYLRIPLAALLAGVLLSLRSRGLGWLSLWCSLWIGVIGGALVLGRFPISTSDGFEAVFIAPWLNSFSLAVGGLTCCLFAHIGGTFLAATGERQALWARRSTYALGCAVTVGAGVFALGYFNLPVFIDRFLSSSLFLGLFGLSALLVVAQQLLIWRRSYAPLRLLSIGQVVLVVAGLAAVQAPLIYLNPDTGLSLSVYDAAAPAATLKALAIALAIALAAGGIVVVAAWRRR